MKPYAKDQRINFLRHKTKGLQHQPFNSGLRGLQIPVIPYRLPSSVNIERYDNSRAPSTAPDSKPSENNKAPAKQLQGPVQNQLTLSTTQFCCILFKPALTAPRIAGIIIRIDIPPVVTAAEVAHSIPVSSSCCSSASADPATNKVALTNIRQHKPATILFFTTSPLFYCRRYNSILNFIILPLDKTLSKINFRNKKKIIFFPQKESFQQV